MTNNEALPANAAKQPADRVNILMVDDQPSKLLSYKAILGELGENLIEANSGREALDCLLRKDIAVVLMDVSMPEIDGFELTKIIRQHPRFQKTAIIFISAVHLTDLDKLKGYAIGAVDYIAVPIIPELLRAKVSVFAELHRKTRQLESMNRELEDRAARLAAAEGSLRTLSASLMRSQDDERRRLARTLHDGLGQYLVAMKMQVDTSFGLVGGSQARAALSDLSQQIENAVAEMRSISYLLHPPLLDEMGLETALVWYAEGYSARSGISVNVAISPTVGRLKPETETALFRIVQECLTNVHRHSGSPTATIRLARGSDGICLEVEDEGKGMPETGKAGPSPATQGVGIEGMRERVWELGGRIEFLGGKVKGTKVMVTLPDCVAVSSEMVNCDPS